MKKHSIRPMSAVAVSILVAVLGACGSDDDSSSGVAAEACDAAVAYGVAFSQAPQDPAEFKSFATESLVPIGDDLVASLDGAAQSAATTLRDTFVQIGETGDPSLLESPATAEAIATVGSTIHDGCDLEKVDITAAEYAFAGAPAKVDAGRVSFALENVGVEDHEMVLFKRADDATESLDELLQLPEEELMSKVAFTGVAFGGPGTTSYVAVDLDPGTYFLLCFLPQGGSEEAPPHFMAGMKQTLEVS